MKIFEGGPGAITACDGPINAAGNSCYPAGEILDGVEVDSVVPTDPANNTVVVPAGAFGNPDVWVGPNTFVDVLEINFRWRYRCFWCGYWIATGRFYQR